MGKDMKRRFVVSLDISTKDAEKQIRSTVGNLKTILADMGKASGKMGYFKELVDYLYQIDAEIDIFKQKHGEDLFNKVFGELDASLRTEMERLFGTAKTQMDQLEQIRARMVNVQAMGDTDEARAEMKALEQDVRDLFAALGKADEVKLSGRGKIETRLANMEDALNRFAVVWDGVVGRIESGFSFGGVDSGTGSDVTDAVNGITKEVQEAIDRLKKQKEEYEEIVKTFSSGGRVDVSLPETTKEQIGHLNSLKEAFESAKRAKQRLEATNMTNGDEYLEAVANYTKAAAQLKAGLEYEDLTDESMEWINNNALDVLEEVDVALDNIFKRQQALATSIKTLYDGKITGIDDEITRLSSGQVDNKDTIASYDTLKKKVQEYYDILHQRDRYDVDSDEWHALDDQLNEIVSVILKIKQLDKDSLADLKDVFGDIEYGDIRNVEDALTRICEILKIEIPAAAGVAGESVGVVVGDTGAVAIEDRVERAKTKMLEFRALAEDISTTDFFEIGDGERDFVIGKYTERLEAAKKELDELGEQGLITANELEVVQDLFDQSSLRLRNRLSGYTGFGDGSGGYDYYDEYEHERRRADDLEEENQFLIGQLDKYRYGSQVGGINDGDGEGYGSRPIDVNLTSLEETIKSEADAINNTIRLESDNISNAIKSSGIDTIANKMDDVFKVELVKDDTKDVQESIDGIKQSVDKIVTNIEQNNLSLAQDKRQTAIDNMKQNLLQMFDVVSRHNAGRDAYGKYQRQELGMSIFSDGSISVSYGEKGSVPWANSLERLVANLGKTLIADIHSHPLHELLSSESLGDKTTYVSDSFSGSDGDLSAFRTDKKLGARIAAMITGNILKVLDLSRLSPEIMNKFVAELKKVEKEYADSGVYDDFIGINDKGHRFYKAQDTLEGQHAVTKIFESMMYEAFERVGLDRSQVDNDVFQAYNLTDNEQLTALSVRLVDIMSSAENAVSPLQRLADIIEWFGGDITTTAAQELLKAYDKGELKASDVFNEIVHRQQLSEDRIQSLLHIDAVNQLSPLEAILSNISNILSAISSSVDNIELNTSKNASEQIGATIDDITAWFSSGGNISGRLTSGIKSVYDPNNRTEYKYKDVAKYAFKANNNFLDLLDMKSRGDVLTGSELNDVFVLINAFKTALSYMQDLGKQAETLGYQLDTSSGEYIHPDTGEILEEYGDIRRELLNASDVIEPFIQTLTSMKSALRIGDSNQHANINNTQQYGEMFKLEVGGDTGLIASEAEQLALLKNELESIVGLIHQKNQGFRDEADIVGTAVQSELTFLESLYDKLNEILNMLDAINGAFATASHGVDVLSQKISVEANTESDAGSNTETSVVEHEPTESGYALEKTLLDTNNLLTQILTKIGDGSSFAELVEPLKVAVEELKNVANGIIEHQKAQRTDLTDSSSRIANNYGQLSSIAGNTVTDLGDEVKIENMKALADNVVRVKGAVRDASGVWKGFVVDIDESNNAVIRAVDEQSAFARSLNETAEAAKNAGRGVDAKSSSPSEKPFTEMKQDQEQVFAKYIKDAKSSIYITDAFRDRLDQLAIELQSVGDEDGLLSWIEAFNRLKNDFYSWESLGKQGQTKQLTGLSNALEKEMRTLGFSVYDDGLTSEQEDIRRQYLEIIQLINEQKLAVQNGEHAQVTAINEKISALRVATNEYKTQNGLLNTQGKSGQKYGATAVQNATARYNSLQQIALGDDFNSSVVVQSALKDLTAVYDALIAKRKELSLLPSVSDKEDAEFRALTKEYSVCAKALDDLIKKTQKLRSQSANGEAYMLGADFSDTDAGRKAALEDFVQQIYGADVAIEQFKNGFNECVFAVDNGDGTFTQMTAKFTEARNEIVALAGDTKKATTFIGALWDEMKGKFRTIFTYLTASFGWQEIFQQIRKGVQYVREIDSALTELKKVTDETDASYAQFLQDISKKGSVVGATVADLTTMASEWARLGYSMEEAGKLAESTAILLNVSEFTDATQASEALISTMQAFQYTADESQHVVDILNEVGNNYAVSSDGIAIALQDSASALMEGGNNLEQAVALVASANKVVNFVPRRYSNIAA